MNVNTRSQHQHYNISALCNTNKHFKKHLQSLRVCLHWQQPRPTALRDKFEVLFIILMFHTALFPCFRHFDPSLCSDTGSPSSVCALKVTNWKCSTQSLCLAHFPMIGSKVYKVFHSCLSGEKGCNKFHILRMHMETTASLRNSAYPSLTYSCLCARF